MANLALLNKAQFALAINTLTDVFTAPANRRTTVTLYICNRGPATTFRLSIGLNGAADDPKQYIYYDANMPINNVLKEGFTLNGGDVMRVRAGSATVSVSVYPDESEQLFA